MNLFIPSSRRRCLPDFKHVSTFSLIDLVNPVNPVQQIFAVLAALREDMFSTRRKKLKRLVELFLIGKSASSFSS